MVERIGVAVMTLGIVTLALTLMLWQMFEGMDGWPEAVRVGFYVGRTTVWVAIALAWLVTIRDWLRRRRGAR